MLVTCVITAVIVFIVYTVIKIKIEEWLEELRMSRLHLKRHKLEDRSPIDTIEISTDESDSSQIDGANETNNKRLDASLLDRDYDEETLFKFQKSTDSIQSDEDIESSRGSSLDTKRSMFNWNHQKPSLNKINFVEGGDSDSSDDFNQGSKKLKSTHDIESSNKVKQNDKKEDATPEVEIQYEQMISGIRVKFPVKPYSCQIAVTNKLIQGCLKKENCLLESPTGSGKTLALLCGVLAWHDHYSAEVEKQNNAALSGGNQDPKTSRDSDGKNCSDDWSKKCCDDSDDFEDYFEETIKDEMKKIKVPKIYYGTRTHKQIEQVVRELRKTCYKHKKMTILSSREHTCIQESTKNKTELCNELLDPAKHKGCPFYNESNKKTIGSFSAVKSRGLGAVWDIEDLVAIGKNEGSCPYFAARSLMEQADIIFCPYNYIISPDIRESMQLDLKDQVIILDEAHNIEDICREVASVTFREDHLNAAALECESLTNQRAADFTTYNTLKVYIYKLVQFLKDIGVDKVDNSDNLQSPYWTGVELLELFNMHDLGETTYPTFLSACNAAISDTNKAKEESRLQLNRKSLKPVISPNTKSIIEHLMFATRMITSKEYMNDYRACVTESVVKDFKYATEDTWHSAKKFEHRARTLKLLCMNPGVIFSPLALNAHSIILASGTLTPTASFQSELRTAFAHVLNTGHVIPKEQVYATCVPAGPTGITLRANYQHVNTWNFQDELGRILLDICESMPHGILCFFSSYNVMHTQLERWRNINIWNKITNVKQVFIEPRYGGDLTSIMQEYHEVIEETSSRPRGNITGALFFAVFRGKVAEGIDFRDNEARCVVTVGIPYAVRKDPVIDMKLKYNDKNLSKGLLKGSDWYSIQAFRALNQALGRCLRHIHDWGAVLLVDERFMMQSNKENLPKWVKTMWKNQSKYNLREELRNFVARQKERESRNVIT